MNRSKTECHWVSGDPGWQIRNNLEQCLSDKRGIIDLIGIILKHIFVISKLGFHCRMKVRSLRELEPSNGGFGSRSLGLELFIFKTLLIASVNAVASGSCGLEVGVSSSAGSMCADPMCADMLAGVGGWVGGWVTGLEFPELSRKVKLSSIVPALIELQVKC